MSRTALFCAVISIAATAAAPTFCATVDLSSALPAQPITASGVPLDTTALLNDAAQVGNGALSAGDAAQGAGGSAQGAAQTADSTFGGAAPLDAGGLTNARGGANVTFEGAITNQDLSAVNTGNAISAAQVINGQVSIGPGAFSGFTGVGNFLMNTGNQNNIQGSLSINVVIPASALP